MLPHLVVEEEDRMEVLIIIIAIVIVLSFLCCLLITFELIAEVQEKEAIEKEILKLLKKKLTDHE